MKRFKGLEIEIANLRNNVYASETKEAYIPDDFIKFNSEDCIGLPLHPKTRQPTPLISWELDAWDKIQKYKHLLFNKARKIGVTEFILRVIAYNVFHDYRGYDVMIVAQRQDQAFQLMERFQNLFKNIPTVIRDKTAKIITFTNDTRVFAFPSNSESFRGPDRVKCIFLDEAAHFTDVDDEKVLAALMPNLAGTDGHMFMVSTPFGPRGFFWRIYNDPESEFYKFTLRYEVGFEYSLIDRDFIKQQEKTNTLFEQEYCNQFLAASSSIFKMSDLEDIFK